MFNFILKNGDNALPPDDEDCLENEEEYDALNDETFGALEDTSSLDDWEQQHEQFAEFEESAKHSDKLGKSDLLRVIFLAVFVIKSICISHGYYKRIMDD